MKPKTPRLQLIVTTTTPCLDRRSPSKEGSVPVDPMADPPLFAPPWIQSITGFLVLAGHSGVHTLKYQNGVAFVRHLQETKLGAWTVCQVSVHSQVSPSYATRLPGLRQ
jgi:hypothetical protein